MDENIKITDQEMEAIEAEAENSEDIYVHRFRKPFTYEGVTYTELTFNFDSLTGRDALAIESEIVRLGKPIVVRAFSGEYQMRIAVRCCVEPIGTDLMEALPMPDFNRIIDKAKGFLLRSEL